MTNSTTNERGNFYSDTQTRPSRAMLEACLDAPVGDEQSDRDPTTRALCERVADMLGQEAAVFLPSGTMCNEIALAVHARPGDEVICDATSHIVNFEGGGPAALSGLMIRTLDGDLGRFTVDQVRDAIRTPNRYAPRSRIVSVEQTANLGGGAIWPAEQLIAVAEVAKEHGLAAHMDGARLMNAAVAAGIAPSAFSGAYDSVWIDFTKGLGAPVGAVLAGSQDFIDQSWRFKQMWGGAMRQSGVLAAMCLYALDHNVDTLAEDHAKADKISAALAKMPAVAHIIPSPTNIIFFDLAEGATDAPTLAKTMGEQGFRIGAFSDRRIRIVTHRDVSDADTDALVAALWATLD